MKLLKELQQLLEDNKKSNVSKDTAAKVYHRDYTRTKNKRYRKYNPSKEQK